LIGVGGALGFDLGMVAGAVFLAPISEINYHQCQTQLTLPLPWLELICLPTSDMTLTTIPTYVITMILFIVLGLSVDINGDVNIEALLTDIEASFTISLGYCGACDCYWLNY
jgi:NhaC family Na+:H+ antiporter